MKRTITSSPLIETKERKRLVLPSIDTRTTTKLKKINLYKDRSSSSLKLDDTYELLLSEERKLFTKIRSEYLTDDIDYEVCGIINTNENSEFIIDKFKTGNRYSCDQYSSSVIFHTHPDKIYPSVEDIIKILYYEKIHISYIICKEGFFKIGYNGISINKTNIDKNELEEYVQQYYFMDNTNKGRNYNRSSMNKYTKGFTSYMKNKYPEFYMKFYVFI